MACSKVADTKWPGRWFDNEITTPRSTYRRCQITKKFPCVCLIFAFISDMNPMIRFALIASFLLLSTHRSPAPVAEPDKLTPTPTPVSEPTTAKSGATENEEVTTPIVARASKSRPEKSSSGTGSRLTYSPQPPYPPVAGIARWPLRGAGDFKVTFGTNGEVTNVEVVRTTNHDLLDRAAIAGLRRWKARPGPQWSITVPVAFLHPARDATMR